LGVMVAGSLLFIPAALSANFLFFLLALFTLGTGLTILTCVYISRLWTNIVAHNMYIGYLV
ncbi:hypothetical protein KKF73_04380, partial [Patescibacteria group bacterium]|nr:hypothetical protein [Patescibacteria group bacterium]